MRHCEDCGAETRAKPMPDGTQLCGPCKRAEQRRGKIRDTTCCGEMAEIVDDGLYHCYECNRNFEGATL